MTSKPNSVPPPLSPAQQELMEIVWDQGEVSASEVGRILAPKRRLARNTVKTLLLRMEEKGWLTHREDGRTHRYRAAVPRQVTIGKKVVELIDTLCGGSPEALMTALLDHRGLSDAEAKRIREMLDTARQTRKRSGA
jgi:BlaI family transcriptional regulator, penicillinase repressor